jgi:hypothetical protein
MKYTLSNELKKHYLLNLAVKANSKERQEKPKTNNNFPPPRLSGRMKIIVETDCNNYEVKQPSGNIEYLTIHRGRSASCDIRLEGFSYSNSIDNIDFNDDETNILFQAVERCLKSRFSRKL